MKILFCGFETPGMLLPLMGIAIELRARGHEVRFVSGLGSATTLGSAGLSRIPRGTVDGKSFDICRWYEAGNIAVDYKHITYALSEFRADCIVTNTLCLAPLLVRERYNIPVIVLGLLSYPWPALSDSSGTSAETRARCEWRLNDMIRLLNLARDFFRLPPLVADASSNPFVGDLYLLRTVPEFGLPTDLLPEQVRYVGGCHWEAPLIAGGLTSAEEWRRITDQLQQNEPVVYVQCGRTFGKASFWQTLVDAVREMPVRIVASVGRFDGPAIDYPDNVTVCNHAPQGLVIPHARIVVSPGYTTPTVGALVHGRPQLLLPTGGETLDNAERVVEAGCAVCLMPPSVNVESLQESIRTLLDDSRFTRAAQRVEASFGRLSSFDVAANMVEEASAVLT